MISRADIGTYPALLAALSERAVAGDHALLEIDLKPDYPETPRNWEMLVENAFTFAGR